MRPLALTQFIADRSLTRTRFFHINCTLSPSYLLLLTASAVCRDIYFSPYTLSRNATLSAGITIRRCLQRKIYRITVGQIFVLVRGRVLSSLRARLQVVDTMVDGNCDREILFPSFSLPLSLPSFFPLCTCN